jgi:O-antigen ligase
VNSLLITLQKYKNNQDLLTLWMNNLLVVYSFLLPISQTIKSTVFSVMVLLFFLRGNVLTHLQASLSNKVVLSFVFLFLAYVIGLLWTEDMSAGLSAVKSIKYGLYLILFYAIIDGRYIDKIIGAFILGMLVSELTSYGMIFGLMPWKFEFGGILFYQAYAVGDPSPFLHHIHYGVALAFTVLLLGQKIYFNNYTKVTKIFMSLFILTATTNIFVTGGRTGYLTFFLLIVVLSIFYLRKFAIAAFVAIILVFITAYNLSPIFHVKVLETKNSLVQVIENKDFNSSLGIRAGLYYYASDIIKINPFFGVGTGDSLNEILKISPKEWSENNFIAHEHNQYLSILVKLGAAGLLVFLNIYYQIFKYKQEEKDLRFIMIFSTLAIAFGILTTQFNLRFFLPLWVVMLAITLINRKRVTIQNIKLDDKKQLLQIVAVGIFFSGLSLFAQIVR